MVSEKKELLRNVVDLHIHAGPSVASRSVDAIEMLYRAEELGYKALVIKDHYFPTMLGTEMIDKHIANSGTRIFGGICLNNAIGVFNLNAVDTACAMGAKFIWMPTLSAKQHMDAHKGRFVGSGNMVAPEKPIYYLNEEGELCPEVIDVLKLVANHPEIVFATGHGSVNELRKLIPKAIEVGIHKIFINHPYFIVNASIDDVIRWTQMGAYVELNGALFKGVTGSAKGPNVPLEVALAYISRIPSDRIVITSDSGQKDSIMPDEVLYRFIRLLMNNGITNSQIEMMSKITPSKLINI